MESSFYIRYNIKTISGYESFAKFSLGSDAAFAAAVFGKLKGQPDVTETSMLTTELVEEQEGLPVNIRLMSCTLDQVAQKHAHHYKRSVQITQFIRHLNLVLAFILIQWLNLSGW